MLSVTFSDMLWFKTIVAVRRNSIVVLAWTVLEMSCIQTFSLLSQPTLIFLWITLFAGFLLCLFAATAGVADGRGEADKDSRHEAAVRAAGGIFILLVVETLGLWSPNSLAILRSVALRTTSKSSVSLALGFCHFLEQFFMCLWRYNSQMLLHHLCKPATRQPVVGAGRLIPPL